jgi:quinol-cytochrome oxidoreductase complex cytochrome b subunit
MSTTSTETPAPGADRFARRQRTWDGVPGVPAGGPIVVGEHDAATERDLRATVVGEHLRPGLRGTFFPDAIFQTTVVVLIIFAILLILTAVMPPTVGSPADPLNKELYLPRPAWYFYFLFAILEVMKGPILVPIGTFFLPNIALIALILLPFYDRNRARKIWKRPLAILFFGGSMLFIVVTTIINVVQAPAQPTTNDQNHAPAQNGQQTEIAGTYFTW